MTGRSRFAALALVVVVAVVAFVIARPGTSKKRTTGVVQILVRRAKPVGGVKTIAVSKGEPVRFRVTSDVADEIHVHGYNYRKGVAAGGSVNFDFPAKIDGIFVVELERRSEQIASLRVQP